MALAAGMGGLGGPPSGAMLLLRIDRWETVGKLNSADSLAVRRVKLARRPNDAAQDLETPRIDDPWPATPPFNEANVHPAVTSALDLNRSRRESPIPKATQFRVCANDLGDRRFPRLIIPIEMMSERALLHSAWEDVWRATADAHTSCQPDEPLISHNLRKYDGLSTRSTAPKNLADSFGRSRRETMSGIGGKTTLGRAQLRCGVCNNPKRGPEER